MTEEKTLAQLLEEYNRIGREELIPLGIEFRERNAFKDQTEANRALLRQQSTIRAVKSAQAAQVKKDGEEAFAENIETEKEAEMAETKTKTAGKKKAAAKKKAAPKKDAAKGRGRKSAYTDDQKITVVLKDNPRREGTDVHKHYETMKKSNTVGAYLKAGGSLGCLRTSIKRGWAKVA